MKIAKNPVDELWEIIEHTCQKAGVIEEMQQYPLAECKIMLISGMATMMHEPITQMAIKLISEGEFDDRIVAMLQNQNHGSENDKVD